MRVLTAVCMTLLLSCISGSVLAARYWIASGPSNWNNTANWSTASGGAGGASVPGTTDDVNFDNNGIGNCSIDVPVSVKSITVNSGYTGTISQGLNAITTSGAVAFSGGVFSGGTANIKISGSFLLNGSVFTSTSGILELKNAAVTFTSGTFNHNNGTVRLNSSGQTLSGISPVFYILELVATANTYTISSTGNITVMNSLNITGTLFYNLTGGAIDVKGDINCSNTATGCGGTTIININGTGAQAFNGSTVLGGGALPQLTINKTSGTLSLTNYPGVSNNFTYTAGTVSPGSSTFCFTHGNTGSYAITGSLSFNNIAFPINTSLLTLSIDPATTLTVPGDLTLAGAGNLVMNTGAINVSGNVTLTNTGNGGGGTTTINLVGSGNQNLDGTAITVNQSRLPVININKTAGTLSLLGNISFSANVFYTSGTVAPGISTCYVVNNMTFTGSFSVYNLSILAAGNTTVTVASGTVVAATHTLDLENAGNYIVINTGTIAVQGDIIDNNTNLLGGGTGTILINGTGTQTISTTGVLDQGRFPGVTINKPSGTLVLPALMTVRSDWNYIAGTLDVTTNNSNVVFENTMNIAGTHTLNNITFNGNNNYNFTTAAGTTITVSGNIYMIGTGNITLNTGTYNLIGNLVLSNTGGGGGTSVIAFAGSSNQAITSSLLIHQNCLPSITINKPSGTLLFPPLITVRGNWVYAAGTMDLTSNNSTIVFMDPLGTGLWGITGSHSLNNVTFEASNNSTLTVSTGTTLTITGAMSVTGTANMFFNAPVTGATVIQAQGNISVSNTGTGGGGTGVLLINGIAAQTLSSSVAAGKGLLPFVTIQKTSGTLTLNGILSESRTWTFTSGTVDAATNASTVVFGGNNLSIASAGMSFYHVVFSANTSTLTSSLTALGNLTISGTGVLAPQTNTINLGGNWTNGGTAGFTEAGSTVNFNGASLQSINTTGGENFTNLTAANTGAGLQLGTNATVAGTLTMTSGNVDLNANVLTLGLSAINSGTLSRTDGTIINTGSFVRWIKTGVISLGSVAALFPVGTAADYRPMYVFAPVSGPSTGGTLSMTYNDASGNTTVSIADNLSTISTRKNFNWTLKATGIVGGAYSLQVQSTGMGVIGAVADLRLSLANGVVGTSTLNGGTVTNPQVNRSGLLTADLTNSFYVGSVNSINTPLPVTLVSFTAVLVGKQVDLKWTTATETQNEYFTILRSRDGVSWDSVTRVNGQGESGNLSYYEAFDSGPYSGTSFYRLKNTDFDGHSYFSAIRSITASGNGVQIKIYPNPAANQLSVVYAGYDPFGIRVFDGQGRQVMAEASNVSSRILDISHLSPGLYFIEISAGDFRQTTAIGIAR